MKGSRRNIFRLLKSFRGVAKNETSEKINVEKELCINGSFVQGDLRGRGEFPEMYLGKWDGGTYEVDTEASSDEGSLGASLCDSVGSEERAMGFEDTVRGKLVSECLGKERQLHEGVAQVQLRGSLNVHGSLSRSKKEKAESLIEHDSFSYAKKEKVESSLNDVADISKETKSSN
ncbi:hypothetical protein ACSQ67_011464 [Phaseolus vulgaris]